MFTVWGNQEIILDPTRAIVTTWLHKLAKYESKSKVTEHFTCHISCWPSCSCNWLISCCSQCLSRFLLWYCWGQFCTQLVSLSYTLSGIVHTLPQIFCWIIQCLYRTILTTIYSTSYISSCTSYHNGHSLHLSVWVRYNNNTNWWVRWHSFMILSL